MKTDESLPGPLDSSQTMVNELREQAEQLARKQNRRLYVDTEMLTPEKARELLHDLHVHQIELEMQNDELRRAQTELEEAKTRYFDLYDMAPVGFCTLSENGTILEANLTIANMLRTGRGSLPGKPFSKWVYRDDQDEYFRRMLLLFEQGGPQTFDIRLNGGGGTVFWAKLDAAVQGEAGEGVCRLAISDVTARKQAEEALQLSEQRALDLVEELLKADKNKNEFLYMLSHELRNPLAAIIAGISLFETPARPEQEKRAKETVKRQATQLCRLVDDLLDLTRITEGRIRLRKRQVDANQLAKVAARDMAPQFETKGIRLETSLSQEPLYIAADPVRLTQAVENLLVNALKFTDEGYALLTVRREQADAVIRVEDSGIGVDPDMLPKLFEPFEQAEDALYRRDSGLGIGLAITKSIAELHGGTVYASSAGPGAGAAFEIRLPVSPASKQASPEPAKQRKTTQSRKTAHRRKVLVIEDNEDLAAMLCDILRHLGNRASYALTGAEGLKRARLLRPDAVFCDIGLPGMNGYEVARRIRQDDAIKDTYLVALTGYAASDDVERAVSAGYDRHAAKPVDAATLQLILSDAPARAPE